jgi:hypothetical protein
LLALELASNGVLTRSDPSRFAVITVAWQEVLPRFCRAFLARISNIPEIAKIRHTIISFVFHKEFEEHDHRSELETTCLG